MLSTVTKIAIARALNRAIVGARRLCGKNARVDAVRGGIKWRLDLDEGIDLAIYLGRYQKIPRALIDRAVPRGSLVFDIGANVGAHTLPLARLVGSEGCVVAVEPTGYAMGKLKANIGANSDLAPRIVPIQAALVDAPSEGQPQKAFYSSWPLRSSGVGLHQVHLGQLESAEGTRSTTLDTLVRELRDEGRIAGRIAFAKIDVDGNELGVLRGGPRVFTGDRPALLMEIAPYLHDEQPGGLGALLQVLSDYGYRLEYAETGREFAMTPEGVRRAIPAGASLDVAALPR